MNTAGISALAPGHTRSPSLREVATTPPRPVIRTTLVTLLATVAALLVWSFVAQLDIVATAPGRLVPVSQVKSVQAAEPGVVQELRVHEGDRVRAGDVLLRLDPTLARAESAQVASELQWKRLTVRAIDAELAQAAFLPARDDPPRMYLQVQAQFRARRQALEDAVAQEREVAARAGHEMMAAQRQLDKLRQTLPTYRQAADSYAQLLREGFIGELAANEKQRDAIERAQDLKAQEATVEALTAALAQSERRQQQLRSSDRADLLRERVEAQAALQRLEQDVNKTGFRARQLDLVAPQDGTVKDLVVRAAGYVAQPGSVLMRIVPDGDPLVAEAVLANEDVGFVEVGQPARVKLMTYPFQKYGMLDAHVTQISADALDENERAAAPRTPLAYRAVLELAAQRLIAPGGGEFELTAGMAATIEIHQGRRTVMEFLTSPVRKIAAEAGRER
jgi:HlyD family secretion protein